MRTKLVVACALTAFVAISGGTAEATGLIHTIGIAKGAVTFNRLSPGVQKMVSAKATPGADGSAGTAGIPGTDGLNGAVGAQGLRGFNGIQGLQGIQGLIGLNGAAGTNGAPGAAGTNGAPGLAGTNGAPGAAGTNGAPGLAGTNGAVGSNGLAGTNGAVGSSGLAGTNGAPGAAGTNGAAGAKGDNGLKGEAGAKGDKGDTGSKGDPGTNGAPGANGTNGAPGANGTNGAAGAPGANGTYVVVTQVTGGLDSNVCGGNWATEDYTRTPTFTMRADGTIDVMRVYNGTFTTIAAASSPNDSTCALDQVGGKVGSFTGTDVVTFTGGHFYPNHTCPTSCTTAALAAAFFPGATRAINHGWEYHYDLGAETMIQADAVSRGGNEGDIALG